MNGSLKLKAIGDVCLHGVDGDPFTHVSEALNADIRFCNLECCLTERTSAAKKKCELQRARAKRRVPVGTQFRSRVSCKQSRA